MYPRTNYEMTEDDLKELLDACKPTPVMFITGGRSIGNSPQENANLAWERLGKKMGFDHMTVRPDPSKGNRFFTAVPSETTEQREARLASEKEAVKQAEIVRIKGEIAKLEERLRNIE